MGASLAHGLLRRTRLRTSLAQCEVSPSSLAEFEKTSTRQEAWYLHLLEMCDLVDLTDILSRRVWMYLSLAPSTTKVEVVDR